MPWILSSLTTPEIEVDGKKCDDHCYCGDGCFSLSNAARSKCSQSMRKGRECL